MMNFETIQMLKEETEQLFQEMKESFEEDDPRIDKVKKAYEKLHIIVGFGRGFWAGAEFEYALVYHQPSDSYFWVYLDYSQETLKIKKVKKDDNIFSLLQEFNPTKQFWDYDDYFDNHYPTLEEATVEDIGFSFLSQQEFMYNVWWHVGTELRVTRDRLESLVKDYQRKKKEERLKSFVQSHQNQSHQLVYEHGKVWIVFEDGTKYEILVKE